MDDAAPSDDLTLTRADFDDPALVAFLEAHLEDIAPTAPAESQHALDLRGLRAPGVRLWVATSGSTLVGTGALAALSAGHEEVKSMRTDPAQRGRGVARRLLQHLLQDARERGVRQVSLETGSQDFFAPARALYEKAGFSDCPPFGSYREDPNSVFMTLLL
jgi:putative acetyltransferase